MTVKLISLENTKFFKFISHYCCSSTLHGIKFIGEPSRPYWEKIFWSCILFLSLFGGTKLTLEVWEKWQDHPVIITYSDKTTPISKIPFPAITICPTINVKRNTIDIFDQISNSNQNSSFSEDELEAFEVYSILCEDNPLEDLLIRKNIFAEKFLEILDRLNPPIEETFLKCIWRDSVYNCSSLWTKVITVYGICYTFNSLPRHDLLRKEMIHDDIIMEDINVTVNWDSEIGYVDMESTEVIYPRRVLTAGFEIGMTLNLIGISEDAMSDCGKLTPGFLLFLHAPNDYPDCDRTFAQISFGQEVLIAVKPAAKITSSKLIKYSPEKRQCYFSYERYLRFFKIYTQNNCEFECLGNYSLAMCNCLPFYFPRPENVSICRIEDQQCVRNASQEMLVAESENGECKSYSMEVSDSDVYESQQDLDEKDNSTWDLRAESVIFFKEDHFWMSKRIETYGMTEFFANCGGVLGLLMGFSVLSLVEIVYFLTFRLFRFSKT